LAGGSAAVGLGGSVGGQGTRKVLRENDRTDIGTKGQEILERAFELGRDYEAKYGSCSQRSRPQKP